MDSIGPDWSLAQMMKIQLKTMHNPIDWGVKYEICTDINDDRFVQLNDNDLEIVNDNYIILICYGISGIIENGMAVVDMFQNVDHDSLLCKYNRKYSGNSCWNENIMGDIDELETETCNDRYIENINNLSLDYILNIDGVTDNKCLIEIRRNTYDDALYTFGDDVNLRVCNEESDYKWNE